MYWICSVSSEAITSYPLARYNIMNFQLLTNGSYDYIRIGDWNNGTLIMQDDELQWPRSGEKVKSVCSKPCQPGYYKVQCSIAINLN